MITLLLHLPQRHFALAKSEGLWLGRGEPEWLFPNDEGNPMDESRVRKVFTTLRYYARWIPNKGRRWADLLDQVTDSLGPKVGTKMKSATPVRRKWPIRLVGRQGLEPWTR
jgi:hypothetical protein